MGPPPNNAQQVYRWSLIAPGRHPLFETGELVKLPPSGDLVARARQLLACHGFEEPTQALESFNLPSGRWLVLPQPVRSIAAAVADPTPVVEGDTRGWLGAALLLGLCSDVIYDRSGPVLWTQNRLARGVRLFRAGRFYGD